MNVLKPHLRITLATLLGQNHSQREIERVTGIDRKTIRAYQRAGLLADSNSPGVATGDDQIPPPRPPTGSATSRCESHREFIEAPLKNSFSGDSWMVVDGVCLESGCDLLQFLKQGS